VVVPAAERHLLDGTHLFNYYFCWEAETAAIALGYGSLYNNSSSPRARYYKVFDADIVEFVSVCDIEPGCEITVDYTDERKNELWF
ncbi:MAG: SET domain-containing protein-lysine N-methyltransferase, partial [Pseudonocardiaceae bacterium]